MPLYTQDIFIQEILSLPPQKGLFMGLDVGQKRIGIAISDRTWTIATSLETIERTTFAYVVTHLKKRIAEFSILGLIVGLPLHMNGTQGRTVQSVRHFIYNLMKEVSLPSLLWDERLSTIAAERALLEADLSRSKRGLLIDKVSAAFILQGFLDRLHSVQMHSRGSS